MSLVFRCNLCSRQARNIILRLQTTGPPWDLSPPSTSQHAFKVVSKTDCQSSKASIFTAETKRVPGRRSFRTVFITRDFDKHFSFLNSNQTISSADAEISQDNSGLISRKVETVEIIRDSGGSKLQCVANFSESKDLGPHGDYPEGKPTWEHLQHICNRCADVLPQFFRSQTDMTFFREDVEFINRIMGIVVQGRRSVMFHLGTLKILLNLRNIGTDMQVLSITPVMEDGTVRIRWRVRYISMLEGIISAHRFFTHTTEEIMKSANWYDGYSILFVDGSGMVFRMVADKIIPDDQKSKAKSVRQRLAEKLVRTATARSA